MEHTSKGAIAAHYLERQILEGRLKPGTPVREQHVARELGISLSPVRDALHRLEAIGLVEIEQDKGARVTDLSRQELEELLEVRILLESYALELARQRAQPEDLDDLSRLCDELVELRGETPDAMLTADALWKYAQVHLRFHERLWQLSRNKKLQQLLSRLTRTIFSFYSLTTTPTRSPRADHQRLIDYVRGNVQEPSQKVISEHVKGIYRHDGRLALRAPERRRRRAAGTT